MEDSTKEMEEHIEKEVEKKVAKGVETGVEILVKVVVSFVVTIVVFKFVWAWVVPDLFPGAVEQELVSASLSWLATVKLAVLVAVISGIYPTLEDAFKKPK